MSEEENKEVEDNGNYGRPLKFENDKQLEEKINEYFNGGCNERNVTVGLVTKRIPIPTITGLALFLGFASRQSFYDYENRAAFSYTIKKARAFVETHYEEMLQIGNTTGAIFALKNMGWKDKIENTNTNLNYNTGEMTKDEVKDISDKLDEEF